MTRTECYEAAAAVAAVAIAAVATTAAAVVTAEDGDNDSGWKSHKIKILKSKICTFSTTYCQYQIYSRN